jgi:hypothetical protein
MPGPLFDCYVLATDRSADLAVRFLDRFLPEREPSFDPADPSEVLGVPTTSTIRKILEFLEANPACAYSLYWRNPKGVAPFRAMLVFTDDGHLILGLSPSLDDDQSVARAALSEMKTFAGSRLGYFGIEEAPVGSRGEFIDRVGRAQSA